MEKRDPLVAVLDILAGTSEFLAEVGDEEGEDFNPLAQAYFDLYQEAGGMFLQEEEELVPDLLDFLSLSPNRENSVALKKAIEELKRVSKFDGLAMGYIIEEGIKEALKERGIDKSIEEEVG